MKDLKKKKDLKKPERHEKRRNLNLNLSDDLNLNLNFREVV